MDGLALRARRLIVPALFGCVGIAPVPLRGTEMQAFYRSPRFATSPASHPPAHVIRIAAYENARLLSDPRSRSCAGGGCESPARRLSYRPLCHGPRHPPASASCSMLLPASTASSAGRERVADPDWPGTRDKLSNQSRPLTGACSHGLARAIEEVRNEGERHELE